MLHGNATIILSTVELIKRYSYIKVSYFPTYCYSKKIEV